MHNMKKLTVVCIMISFGLLVGNAVADETYTCTHGTMERIISVVYQDQMAKIPCEVQYQKNGMTETLWNAQNEVGYCEMKAQEFVEKQRGWGWNCAMAGEPMADDGMKHEGMMKEGAQEGMKEESK
jgi:hypothetical protein